VPSTPTPTTSTYAVLGLLTVAPFTAGELTAQSRRSLHWVWPRSERSLYTEPKRLVELGWATARPRRGHGREVPEYRCTAAGRRALQTWLATAPSAPATEVEAMLRVVFADAGTVDDLRGALEANVEHIHDAIRTQLVAQCRGYLDDGGPFPDRLHLIGLFSDFYLRFAELLDAWTADALSEIDTWPSARGVGLTPAARHVFEAVLDRYG
jgi:PadR family transcriptional regulator, regulatory protein AphA